MNPFRDPHNPRHHAPYGHDPRGRWGQPQRGWGQEPQWGPPAAAPWNHGTLSPQVGHGTVAQNDFMTKVFGWMTMGLGTTALVAWLTATTSLFGVVAPFLMPLAVVQILLVLGLSFAVHRLSGPVAIGGFLTYAALNGLLFSVIFLAYTIGSIAQVFMMTTLTFGFMFVYGWTTKRDLTSIGSLAIMALFGTIVASLINLWLRSGPMDFVLSIAGILIFVALTAYDAQRIKAMGAYGFRSLGDEQRMSVIGALTLYLDFINLFLKLLRLFGTRRE